MFPAGFALGKHLIIYSLFRHEAAPIGHNIQCLLSYNNITKTNNQFIQQNYKQTEKSIYMFN